MAHGKEMYNEIAEKCQESEVNLGEAASEETLSISDEEQTVLKAIEENSVVIIHGDIGSSKSIEVPHILHKAGYTRNKKLIGVTEPQRTAAVAKAYKVAMELTSYKIVMCQIYDDDNVSAETQIKFMTNNVLLKEIKKDPDLIKYSVIIVDEVQERSFYTDVVIGLLSQIIQHRKEKKDKLKVIIMSVTMNIKDFMENPLLFKEEPPVLIKFPSQQQKVQVQYNVQPKLNSVSAAYSQVCDIHIGAPAGGILVFLSDKEEVKKLCAKLQNSQFQSVYPRTDNLNDPDLDSSSSFRRGKKRLRQNDIHCISPNKTAVDLYPLEAIDEVENLQQQSPSDDREICSAVGHYVSSVEGDLLSNKENSHEVLEANENFEDKINVYTVRDQDYCNEALRVLPLYSDLPFEEQYKVFESLLPKTRLCVVTTDVAETFMTIPGIKYVVDSGEVKSRVPNVSEGIPRYRIEWTSKASANRRAGFAGFTERGQCIRLYSSYVFECEFPEYSLPEIHRLPAAEIVLQMKNFGITDVINFPFPSTPDQQILKGIEERLLCLGLLEVQNSERENSNEINETELCTVVTACGSAMTRFQMSPRYAKMILLSHKLQCISPISAIVCAMLVPRLFVSAPPITKSKNEVYGNLMKKVLWKGAKVIGARGGKSLELGDAMVLLRTVALFEESKNKEKFCAKIGVSYRAMTEIHQMRQLIHRQMRVICKNISLPLDLNIEAPTEKEIEVFQKILAGGFADHVARHLPEEEIKLNKELKNAYQCLDITDPVFIHPSSVLYSVAPKYVVYQEIVHTTKYYMKGVVAIKSKWLPEMAPYICEYSDPPEIPSRGYDAENDKIVYDSDVKFGPWNWELPTFILEVPESITKYKWFSYFLLDGQVYDFFKNYRNHLLLSISSESESLSRLLCSTHLFESIYKEKISSRKSLKQKWSADSKYLLKEYLELLPEEKHVEIESQWPPKS